jgi:hypothetical protein
MQAQPAEHICDEIGHQRFAGGRRHHLEIRLVGGSGTKECHCGAFACTFNKHVSTKKKHVDNEGPKMLQTLGVHLHLRSGYVLHCSCCWDDEPHV